MRKIISLFLISFLLQSVQAQMQTTTAAQVKTDFNANWTTGTFPRLYTGAAELQRFKNLIQSGDAVAVATWSQIQSDADAAIGKTIPDWYLDAANLRVTPIHDLSKVYIPQLVIAYQITGLTKYADKAWAVAQKMMTYQDWGVSPDPNYCDRHFLDAGIAGFNVAMLYDGLYNYLTADQRTQLYTATRRLLLVPALARYKNQVSGCSGGWNWADSNNNWGGICNGGVISACLTLFENEPDFLSDVASRGINKLKPWITAFEPDGQSVEGMSYWSYGLMYTVTAFDIMKRTLGTTYGYADMQGMKKTGYFPLFTSGPVASLNIGDDGIKSSISNTILWFAKYQNDNSLAKLYYNNLVSESKKMAWFDMFNYNPEQVNQGSAPTTALDNYISGIAIHSFVERWQDVNAMYLGVHGGSNSASHGHLDAGTFDIQALGQIWLNGDLGPDNYTYPGYFSATTLPGYTDTNVTPTAAGRWHFYRLRAEGKNCLVFNPDYRPDQNESGTAQTSLFDSNSNAGTAVLDLTSCYSRDVNSYKRSYRLDRLHRVITVQDNYLANADKRVWWTVHTKAAISLSTDAQTATLTLNGKQLKAIIRFPHNAIFQIKSATYLDGRTFPLTTNSSNSGFQRLGICLPTSKVGLIRVDYLPLDAENGANELIDNFEGFSYTYDSTTADGKAESIISNPFKDVLNSSNSVLKFTINASVQNLPAVVAPIRAFISGTSTNQYRFFKTNVKGSVVVNLRLKLTNSKDNSTAEFLPLKNMTQTTGWEEVDFDLNKDINGNSQSGKMFDGLQITPEFAVNSNPVILYFDDITLSKTSDAINTDNLFKTSIPANLNYQYRTANSLKLNWDALPGAISYKVFNGTNLLGTSTATSLQLNGLSAGTNYILTVKGVNFNAVESDISSSLSVATRIQNKEVELLDDFEGATFPWTQLSFATISLVPNPLKDNINSSNTVIKIDLNNPTNNYSGAKMGNELFSIPGLRYLHLKILRPSTTDITKNASIKLIEPNTGILTNEKEIVSPVNTIALAQKGKWIDFVFDLGTTNPSNITWNSFFVMPERISSTGINQSYYIDDVLLSNDPTALNGNPVSNVIVTALEKTNINYVSGGLQIDGLSVNCQVELINLSGRVLAHFQSNSSSYFLPVTNKGVYILKIHSENSIFVRKVLI